MEVMERFWKTKKDIFCIAVMILFAVCVMGASFVMFMHGQDSYQIFCLCVMGLMILLGVAVFSLQYFRKVKIEKIYLICGLIMGMLFLFLIPPYATPDEQTHWDSAYQVSNNMMHIQMEEEKDNVILKRKCDAKAAYRPEVDREYFNYLLDNFWVKNEDNTLVECAVALTGVSDVFYLPSAAGITLGRILGAGSVMTILLGGFFNVLFFSLCSYYAMKKLPFGKMILFVFCLLPMTLQQTSSYSYDNIILAATVIVVSMALHWAYGEGDVRKSEVLIYLLASYILLTAKGGTYGVLCFLPFVLKYSREKINRKNIGIVAAFAAFAIVVIVSGSMLSLYTSGGTDAALTGENAGRTYLAWADSYTYTLPELLYHPKLVLIILWNTILSNGRYYLESMVGSPLGWLNILIPYVSIYGFLFLLLAAAFQSHEKEVYLRRMDKIIIWLMCLMGCGISMAAMLLYWTPKEMGVIAGVQGRYFLPMLLPGLFTLRWRKWKWKRNCDMEIAVCVVLLEIITVFSLLRTFM